MPLWAAVICAAPLPPQHAQKRRPLGDPGFSRLWRWGIADTRYSKTKNRIAANPCSEFSKSEEARPHLNAVSRAGFINALDPWEATATGAKTHKPRLKPCPFKTYF